MPLPGLTSASELARRAVLTLPLVQARLIVWPVMVAKELIQSESPFRSLVFWVRAVAIRKREPNIWLFTLTLMSWIRASSVISPENLFKDDRLLHARRVLGADG